MVRILLVNGPSSSSFFFTGRVRGSDFSMGRLHMKAFPPIGLFEPLLSRQTGDLILGDSYWLDMGL